MSGHLPCGWVAPAHEGLLNHDVQSIYLEELAEGTTRMPSRLRHHERSGPYLGTTRTGSPTSSDSDRSRVYRENDVAGPMGTSGIGVG